MHTVIVLMLFLLTVILTGCSGRDEPATAIPTQIPDLPTAPASVEEMIVLADEATAAALEVGPNVYLFTALFSGSESMYLFVSPDGQTQIAVSGPNPVPGDGRWSVTDEPFLPEPVLTPPPPLDLAGTTRGAAEALLAFSEKVDVPAAELRVQVQTSQESGSPFWTAQPLQMVDGQGDRDVAFLCLLTEPNGAWVDPC